jgi:hypothetical protein
VAAWLKENGIRPASHLDIGSSRGWLLDLVGAPVAEGFDLNKQYRVTGKEVGTPGKYELVTAIHVLEHTTSPHDSLVWWASMSSKYVLIEVPSFGAPLRFPHLFYFPPAVLVEMVKRAGMRIVVVEGGDVTRILASVS